MGKLIECSSKLAQKPYQFRLTETNVYSIEEVCYYIRHNIYMMQEEVFDRDFVYWLRDELDMADTAGKIEGMLHDHSNLKDIVVTICCSCDYYDEQQINEIIHIMDETENLPLRGRQKIKADNYFRCGAYEKAVEEYEHILRSDDMLNADLSEYGRIYHNIGVAFANLGDLAKAADSFGHAWEKSKEEASLRDYIFALKLIGDDHIYEEGYKKAGVSTETLQKLSVEFVKDCEQSSNSKAVRRIEKLRETLKSGYLEEYYDKVQSCIHDWKEEYRREISV